MSENSIPTVREILQEKVFESISWLVASVQQGKITEHQFSTGVDAVFMATSGLLDQSVFEFISACQEETPEGAPFERRHLIHPNGNGALLRWEVGSEKLELIRYSAPALGEGHKLSTKSQEFDSPAKAKESVEKAVASLEKAGFRLLS